MARKLFIAVLLSISTLVASEFGPDVHSKFHKRINSVAVVGTPGRVQPRLEITQLETDYPDQHTLLLLALEAFQARDQNSVLSYYQIAGIHGVPQQDWDGSEKCPSCSGVDGYCPHDMSIFPTWHRAYMALFEQEFLQVVKKIADDYTGSTRTAMQNAASTMRFPYWDWAAQPKQGQPVFPSALSSPRVTVSAPGGVRSMDNPLYRYAFADPGALVYPPFTNWATTLRYPSNNSVNALSQEEDVINGFAGIQNNLRDQLYQLFVNCKDWLHFSNDDAGSSSSSCSNSLESIHNLIHTIGGGPANDATSAGHMTYLSLAAFDPLFWLHHMNVDRLLAMWQALNPDRFFDTASAAPHSTWSVASGMQLDGDTVLAPFYKDLHGNYWTSNDVRDWRIFGYDYPEFVNGDGSPETITSLINQLYGSQAPSNSGATKQRESLSVKRDGFISPMIETSLGNLITSAGEMLNAAGELLRSPFVALNGSHFEYVANIHTPRYALNGSYNVLLFDGDPCSELPANWLYDQNLIGAMGIVGQPGMPDHGMKTAGSIPLTRLLSRKVESGEINDLSEATAVPYLAKKLQWRIVGPRGDSIQPDTLPGFKISVFASTSSPLVDLLGLPRWTSFIPLEDVTRGKCGGT